MNIVKTLCNVIDTINRRLGVLFSFLSLGILAVIVCEVFLRRVFNMPQIWTQDMTIIPFVCVDVIFAKLPKIAQYILHIVTYLVYMVPFLFLILPKSLSFFTKAFLTGEKMYSTWQPPVWPMKLCLFIGLLLLAIPGLSEILKQLIGLINALQARKNPPLEQKEAQV